MTQYIKEFKPVNIDIQNKIIDLVITDTTDFKDSELYIPSLDKNIIDINKRNSIFKTIKNTELFTEITKLVDLISEMDCEFNYSVNKNDVTYIKYEKGGFFNEHQDFLTIKSNTIIEFTMIMCESAECVGGRTIFTLNKYFKHYSEYSTNKNHILIFRKDFRHEGELIQSGYKNIIIVNLFGIPKKSESVIAVSFNNDENIITIPTTSVFNTEDNFFSSLIHFTGKEYVYRHICPFTSEEFNIIDKIFKGIYISINDYDTFKYVIDYYCISNKYILLSSFKPINNKIIVDMSKSIVLTNDDYELDNLVKLVKKHNLNYVPFKIVLVEGNINWIYDDIEETKKHIDDYDSDEENFNDNFKSIGYGLNDMWFSVGELHNIQHITCIDKKERLYDYNEKYWIEMITDKKNIHDVSLFYLKHTDYYEDEDDTTDEDEDDTTDIITEDVDDIVTTYEDDSTDIDNVNVNVNVTKNNKSINKIPIFEYTPEYADYSIYFNFEVCIKEIDNTFIHNQIFSDPRGFNTDILSNKILININNYEAKYKNKYWSIDHNDKMFLNSEQSNNLIKYMKKNNFIHNLKELIKTKRYIFPQDEENIDIDLCNECSYGQITAIYITGLINIKE
jgi:hypothetical protein